MIPRISRSVIAGVSVVVLGAATFAQDQKGEPNDAPWGPIATRRYTWAEAEAAIARIQDGRSASPGLQAPLNDWYIHIANPAFTESQDVPEHCAKLGMWVRTSPHSPLPLLAQGEAILNYAWRLRGDGFSNSVDAKSQSAFRDELAKARAVVEQAIKTGVKDGQAYALLIDIARAEGRSLSETRAILDEGRRIDPAYVWLYSAMAEYLLPRWYGKRGDIERFAADVVQMLKGDDGLDAYGHIAYIINQYDGNVLFWGDYDRKLLSKSADVLVRRYPNAPNIVPFAALCTIVTGDHIAARRIRPYVTSTDVPRVKAWKSVAADYLRWCAADEVASGRCKWIWGTPVNYGNLVFSDDSQSIWAPTGLGRVAVARFDIEAGSVRQAFSGGGNEVFEVNHAAAKNLLLASISGASFEGFAWWNLVNDGGDVFRQQTNGRCRCLVVNPKQLQVAWAEGKTVRIFDLSKRQAGPVIEMPKTVERLKYSSDGKLLAVAAGSTSVFDTVTGESRYSLFSFESEPRGRIAVEHLLDFDASGRVWATAYEIGVTPPERSLVRFAADGNTWFRIVPKLTGQVASAVISPDQRLLAMTDNNNDPGGAESIQIWDVQDKRLQMRLEGHPNHIGSMVFSPDGKRLASVSFFGGPIKVWSLEAKEAPPVGKQKKSQPL